MTLQDRLFWATWPVAADLEDFGGGDTASEAHRQKALAMRSRAEEYHEWRDGFLKKRAARKAIKELDKLKKYHPDELDLLLNQVLHACFEAQRWEKRQSEALARRKLDPQIKAVRKLRSLA
jgi:hypothetical protein